MTVGTQEIKFIQSEGDAWHERNKAKVRENLPVVSAVLGLGAIPQKVLEIGCGYGANIGAIQKAYACDADGIEPSKAARDHGTKLYPRVRFLPGTAAELNSKPVYDMIIYGFCLYVCDREDLLRIVAAGDRALKDGGHLIVQDFSPSYPHKTPYHHVPGMFTYKMKYANLWLADPAYTLVEEKHHAAETSVCILKKDIERGWPLDNNLLEHNNG